MMKCVKHFEMFSCWIFLFIFSSAFVHIVESSSNSTVSKLDADENLNNCTLFPEMKRMQKKLDKLIDDKNRLIKLSITVKWTDNQPNDTYPTDVLWYMTTETTGERLLLLHDNFTVMSLGALSYGIADMDIILLQNPENCLETMPAEEADKALKLSLLTLPDTQNAINEDGISNLRICTGSVNNKGSCCKPTLTEQDVRCNELTTDVFMELFPWIVRILALFALMHIVYLIPKSMYADKNEMAYKLFDNFEQVFPVRIKVEHISKGTNTNREHDEKWTNVKIKDTDEKNLLKLFRKELKTHKQDEQIQARVYCFNVKLKSVMMDDDQLVSESRYSPGLSYSLFKTFSDVFLKCKVKHADTLRPIFSKTFFQNLPRSIFLNRMIQCIIWLIFILSSTLGNIFNFKYMDAPIGVIIAASFALMCLPVIQIVITYYISINVKEIFLESLRNLHKKGTDYKFKKLLSIILWPFKLRYYFFGIFLLPFTLTAGIVALCWYSLSFVHAWKRSYPLFVTQAIQSRKDWSTPITMTFLTLLILYTYYFLIESVVFYMYCFSYILIGLLLNFENTLPIAVLILAVFTYGSSCLIRAYKTINDFNNRVMKVLHELIDKDTELKNYLDTVKENKISRLSSLSQPEDKFIRFVADVEGKPCLSTTGLLMYLKFQKPENLPFLHVSERFCDKIASTRGQLTPGNKYSVLFQALLEIVSILIVLLVVFSIIFEFGKIDDLSAGVNLIIAIGSSTALALFNRLMFKADEYSQSDHDLHLKALVKRHIKKFKDLWENPSFEILSINILNCNSVQRPDNQSIDDGDDDNDRETDVVLERCNVRNGAVTETTETWYIRPFQPSGRSRLKSRSTHTQNSHEVQNADDHESTDDDNESEHSSFLV